MFKARIATGYYSIASGERVYWREPRENDDCIEHGTKMNVLNEGIVLTGYGG